MSHLNSTSALESLATLSHQQAEKALVDAVSKLSEPLDQKLEGLKDYQTQIKAQSKTLQQLITSCDTRAKKLSKASELNYEKARKMQTDIEFLNRQIRVVELSKEIQKEYSQT